MRKSEVDTLGFENGRITGFKPRFKSIDDDWERYLEALAELANRGIVPRSRTKSLYVLYAQDLYERLTDLYFEVGRLDQIEAFYTPAGEAVFGPIYERNLKVLDRFMEMGEFARVRRVWRAHTGAIKGEYWWYIGEKKAGFRMMKNYLAPEAKQRKEYKRLISRIPAMKKELLEVMADYRRVAGEAGAPATELARIEADIAAIEAEERPRPKGKPDPRKMDEDLFWAIIENGSGSMPLAERLDNLPERLAQFKATAIREFEKILRTADARAYRWDIWALAYLLQGGCSDDAFEEFRGWLILQGRKVFETALADPDSFDTALFAGQTGGMAMLRDAAPMAYEMRQGKAMRPVKVVLDDPAGPVIAEEDFATHLPRIARLTGAAT